MPEITDDVLFATIREQAAQIKERKLSPVELTNAYLDRLERYGEKLGAVVTITRELGLKQAKEAEQQILAGNYRGLLHGIPYGVKDLLATKAIPTTWGGEPYRKQVFDYDATVVTKLRAAGAILVAKLAMVELAGAFGYGNADASFTGPGRTPWNLDYWSGGSSAGSGAATAAALVSFAIGSETSGSIITPAAYCGLAGLRPTYGRVSRHGAMALCWTMDKLGPMARSADCCGIILAAIAGKDPNDASSVDKPFPFPEPKEQKKYKVGILKNPTAGVQKEVRQNFEESLKVLAKFCDFVEDLELPKLPFGSVVGTIVNAEGASAFRDLLESGKAKELRGTNDKWGGYAGLFLPAVDYLHAMRLRGPMKREMEKLYAPFDAIIAPSRATVASPIDRDFAQAYPGVGGGGSAVIPAGNAVGQPALSVPNGFGLNDLPTGIQFTGRAWSEARLIAIAHAYQERTDWHKERPPFPDKV